VTERRVIDTPVGPAAFTVADGLLQGLRIAARDGGPGSDGANAGDVALADRIAAALRALLHGSAAEREAADAGLRAVPIADAGLPELDRAVLAAIRAIGPGRTSTYGRIAVAVGRPDGAQAIGGALGRNPFPLVVPCHRVLAADGAIGGFSAPGGADTKRRLLTLEGAGAFEQPSLFG
jgi:methylated-DNA-[protein]-cysteine S-methyltransferase